MKTLKIIAINIVLISVLLALIDPLLARKEQSSNGKTYRSLVLREYGPNRTISLSPHGHGVDTMLLDSKQYFIETDEFGFIIGPEDSKTEKPSLLFFGGSTTECAFVDDSLRFPFLVGKSLGTKAGNAGYGGNHSFHSLTNFIGKGFQQEPIRVLWMHNVNDLALLSKTGSYFNSPSNRKVLEISKSSGSKSLKERIKHFGNSFILLLYPNIYKRMRLLSSSNKSNVDEWEGYRNKNTFDLDMLQGEFESSLSSFIGLAKANNIELTVMTQFNRISNLSKPGDRPLLKNHQPYAYSEIVSYYQQFNQSIRDLAVLHDLDMIDLDSLVPKTDQYFYDAVHLNNAGSKMVAQIIIDHLNQIESETNLEIDQEELVE